MDFAGFVKVLLGILGPLALLLIAVALVVFLYGIVLYIASAGNSTAQTKGRNLIMWGLIALTVLTSVWGIATMVSNSLFNTGAYGVSGGVYGTAGTAPVTTTCGPYGCVSVSTNASSWWSQLSHSLGL